MPIDTDKVNKELLEIAIAAEIVDSKAKLATKTNQEKLDALKRNLECADYLGITLVGFGNPGVIDYDDIDSDAIMSASEYIFKIIEDDGPKFNGRKIKERELLIAIAVSLSACGGSLERVIGDDYLRMKELCKGEFMLRHSHENIMRHVRGECDCEPGEHGEAPSE